MRRTKTKRMMMMLIRWVLAEQLELQKRQK